MNYASYCFINVVISQEWTYLSMRCKEHRGFRKNSLRQKKFYFEPMCRCINLIILKRK